MTVLFRTYAVGLIPVAAAIASLALDTAKVTAQNTSEFSVTYDTLTSIDPSFRPEEGILRATITGESTDAPFGLTKFVSNTYGRFDPTTNVSTFDANPAVFGLPSEPTLGDKYFGGSNELFGTASDQAAFNFEEGTVAGSGTITITGGTGIFENASGQITFSQNDKLTSTDLTAPFAGKATLNFSVETAQEVPEPSNNAALVGVGLIGASLMMRRLRASR